MSDRQPFLKLCIYQSSFLLQFISHIRIEFCSYDAFPHVSLKMK